MIKLCDFRLRSYKFPMRFINKLTFMDLSGLKFYSYCNLCSLFKSLLIVLINTGSLKPKLKKITHMDTVWGKMLVKVSGTLNGQLCCTTSKL